MISLTKSSLRFAALVALGLFVAACGDKTPDQPSGGQTVDTTQQSGQQSKPVPAFDENRAFALIEKQLSFGPRVPNTEAHRNALAFFEQELKDAGGTVMVQRFTAQGYNETLNLANVLASFNPSATDRILLLAHWDSRPRSEEEKDPAKKKLGVPAANDGASGVAVLLELAKQFKDNPLPIGVDILLTDGEDYGDTDIDKLDKYFLGAKHFIANKPASYQPRFAILLDLVGDKKAEFKKEGYSMQAAPEIVNFVWNTARDLGLSTFKQEIARGGIDDDHIPLIQGGIRAIDIIDVDLVGHYSPDPERKYWHTQDDTIDKIGKNTLDEVGTLLLTIIYDRLPRVIRTI